MGEPQPPQPGQRTEREKKYSPEKVEKFKYLWSGLQSGILTNSSDDVVEALEEELCAFTARLEEKYKGKIYQYAMIHALKISTISLARESEILYEDFPG